MTNFRIFLLVSFLLFQFDGFSQVLIIQDTNKEPIPYANVQRLDNQRILISDKTGMIEFDKNTAPDEIVISHISFLPIKMALPAKDTVLVQMEFAFQLLDTVHVIQTNEKRLFEEGQRKFQESLINRPSISKAEMVSLVFTDNQKEPAYYMHSFGLYIFHEAVDRSKKKNEWLQAGYNGFWGQKTRYHKNEILESEESKLDNLAISQTFGRENFGYLNDILFTLNTAGLAEADNSYIKDKSVFYVFNIQDENTLIEVHIHADTEQFSRVIAKKMPYIMEKFRANSTFTQMELKFTGDDQYTYLAQVIFENKIKDRFNLKSELVFHEKATDWEIPYKGLKLEAFFGSSMGSYPNYQPKDWNSLPIKKIVWNRFQNKYENLPFSDFNVSLESQLKSLEARMGEHKLVDKEIENLIKIAKSNYEYRNQLNEYFKNIDAHW